MISLEENLIPRIRRFNRFYTNLLGLLDRHLLESDFSLSEARVLFEIENHENCTARRLTAVLRMDRGYLSRILKRFERQGLSFKLRSSEDGRLQYLHLTEAGKAAFAKLNARSDEQIRQMLGALPRFDQDRIGRSLQSLENELSGKPPVKREDLLVRNELRPGDVGLLIHLHGWIYAEECGYSLGFERYVCKTFYDFFETYSPDKDRFWFVEAAGEMIGAIAVVGHSAAKAQLRWFLLHPQFRGLGLGSELLGNALQYCRDGGYKTVFLETTADQERAIRMYEKAGFEKISERLNESWGKVLQEQTYELKLK